MELRKKYMFLRSAFEYIIYNNLSHGNLIGNKQLDEFCVQYIYREKLNKKKLADYSKYYQKYNSCSIRVMIKINEQRASSIAHTK